MENENTVEELLRLIKTADPDMSRQMKSHYKRAFTKMHKGKSSENLVYKLCLHMWEMEDDINWLKENNLILKEANKELKQAKATDSVARAQP